ncbi:DNA-directed RNA polymerase [Echria macrotheca]|uniref:DNA-directed RNA polymerase n=1 Tax=Echria macrotheca TaxID=438768 RepID=A0AAJ0FA23_9PEZI|nr:DNA-directed RNA polymerase [Echria macrotheca]
MNAPDRFEAILLGPGEKKIQEEMVPGQPNTAEFFVKKEDHTLGNMITSYLKKDPNVLFAGYKAGHPNVPEIMIRIQTNGTMTPKEAFVKACKHLITICGHTGREWQKELALRKYADQSEQSGNGNGGQGSGNH